MKQNDETQSRWYMVNKDGMAALCADQADAEQEAKNAQEVWPHMGPHRAVQLSESFGAWFTAADMATAAAQGFRDGQAAELAAMLAGGEPVAWAWNHSRVKEVGPVYMPHPEKSPYLESINATGPIPLYAHPQPAAQDAERIQALELEVRQQSKEIAALANEVIAANQRASDFRDAALAAQQHAPSAAPEEPLQAFDSPRAKSLMRAWEEGWEACRDAEYVGEEAQNDAFNSSHTLTLCLAEDQLLPTPQADSQPAPVLDMAVMQLAESVGLIGPASRVHDLHAAIQRFHDLICVNATIKAAVMAADAISGAAAPAQDYPPLPMQFACSGVFPVYSADQMRAYVDADRAARAPADSVLEDAARYRWIRGPVEESTRYSRWRIEYWDGPNGWQPMQRERMDSAIDSARKQGANHDL